MRKKIAIKNGSITLACQIVDTILGFIVRKFFISYLGIGILGINGTFNSLLNSLSLAELGFESAIIFSLYKPIQEEDTDSIEKIISILKRIYIFVGVFIIIGGAIISYFLPQIITGIHISEDIYGAFYFFVLGNAITYFMAYKRTFLLAQQKDYIRNLFVSLFKLIATIIQILVLIFTAQYLYYVIVVVVQNFAINLAISIYVNRYYNYKFNRKVDKRIFKRIIADVKNIFFGKIAGYVYSSTDNIIISAFVSTISVGVLGNYTQILYQMKSLINSVFNSTRPIIGHFLTVEKETTHSFEVLQNFTFIRFAISSFAFIPAFVLCDPFITVWLGVDYVMPLLISFLLISDIYVHFVHGALVDFIAGLGYFKDERNVSILGAIINLTVSLGLVKPIGIYGVLLGTVISQWLFWICRSQIIFKKYLSNCGLLKQYWFKCIKYTCIFYIDCFVCKYIFSLINIRSFIPKFIVGGLACELFVIISIFICNIHASELKYTYKTIERVFFNSKKN